MLRLAALAAIVASVLADCPNACSGHGLCGANEQCTCDPNYFGSDCSLRVCPSGFSFVDTPRGDLNHDGVVTAGTTVSGRDGGAGWSNVPEYELYPAGAKTDEAHFYSECSGQGECDRALGECKCYPGFTGSSCQRTTCPNDCSGHGICRTLKEIADGALNRKAVGGFGGNTWFSGVRVAFDYNLWDADKRQACICDGGWTGADCSQRQCPRGEDPVTPATPRWCGGALCAWEVQTFRVSGASATTYKFSFTDIRNVSHYAYFTIDAASGTPGYLTSTEQTTLLAGPTTNAGIIMNAIRSTPAGVLARIEVVAGGSSVGSTLGRTFQIKYVGLPGNQYEAVLEKVQGDGVVEAAVSEATRGNYEDLECSGRGNCDGATGLCKCFGGFVGAACEFQNALAAAEGGGGAVAASVSA